MGIEDRLLKYQAFHKLLNYISILLLAISAILMVYKATTLNTAIVSQGPAATMLHILTPGIYLLIGFIITKFFSHTLYLEYLRAYENLVNRVIGVIKAFGRIKLEDLAKSVDVSDKYFMINLIAMINQHRNMRISIDPVTGEVMSEEVPKPSTAIIPTPSEITPTLSTPSIENIRSMSISQQPAPIKIEQVEELLKKKEEVEEKKISIEEEETRVMSEETEQRS